MTSTIRRPPTQRRRKKRTVVAVRQPVSTARIVIASGAMVAVAGALIGRTVDLQATPDSRILNEVYIPLGVVTVPAPRGDIVDRHERTVALSLPAATIVADPRLVVDAVGTAAALSPLLGVSEAELVEKLSSDSAFAYLARQLDLEVGEQVMALSLPGVDLIEEPRREHPNGQCSALAVVGRVNTDHVGMSGLEEIYDDHLSGDSGRIVKEIGTDGTTIPGGSEQVVAAVPGNNIQVTLDRNVQYQAEQLLIDAVENAGAERGVALVAVPSTGEIIAMANVDRGDDGLVSCTRQNLAATWSFEPGSIIKPITISGVLTAELAGEHYPIPVEPTIEIYDHQFRDDPWHDVVDWTPTEILTNSSNVGTIKLAQLLGEKRLKETVVAFGLGSRTELNFKGEASGIVLPLDEWSGLTLPNVAIGQGIAATPLQMLQAYNTIANDGVRVAPRLVIDETTPVDRVRVIDQATAAALERMMSAVVREGTGTRAAISGYPMAGKTGTAWQPCDEGYTCINENNEADGRHHTASFAGIVSNDQGPALTILVIIDEPQGETVSGGRVAAPVAAELAEYALRQLRIPAASGAAPGERQRAEPAQVPLLILPSDDAEEDVT